MNMSDETIEISAKTWAKRIDGIHKVKYSDGVLDGENKSFQASFDMGYEEGFLYGFKLGSKNAKIHTSTETNNGSIMRNEVNCIICMDSNKLKDNVINLYNLQKEKNNEAFL